MESVDFMDKYLDPPAIPEYAECAECHEVYHADDLNDDDLCGACEEKLDHIKRMESEG